MKGLRKIILDLKIYFTLHFIYPSKEKYKLIKSILPSGIEVGENVSIAEEVEISSHLKKLEDGTYIGRRSYIGSCERIGKYSSISFDVKIGLISHPLSFISTSPVFYAKRRGWVDHDGYNENEHGMVKIGHDVLISANAIIKNGVSIGNGAVIGAGAFVNRDVPPYAVVGGVPARVIKYRFDEATIKRLEESAWWEMSKRDLLKVKHFFHLPEAFLNQIKNRSNFES